MPDQLTAEDLAPMPLPTLSDAKRDQLVIRVALSLLTLDAAAFVALLLATLTVTLAPRLKLHIIRAPNHCGFIITS